MVVGSKEFVDSLVEVRRDLFRAKRTPGARGPTMRFSKVGKLD
jgi:hypothetical protein